MNCPNCGSNADGVFCAVCGAKLPGNPNIELDPNALRLAAEKAAEEAEAMKRRYEEAAKAANDMLVALQAEESAAARARAEREEALKRAVSEAEALLSDKTSKLAAAQSEQKAAERVLAERKAAIAEYQKTGFIPDTINNGVPGGGWTPNPEFPPIPTNPMRQPDQAHIPPQQPEHTGYQEPVWPAPDLLHQPHEMPHNSTGIPNNTPIQPGTSQPWMEKTAPGLEPVNPNAWPPGGPHQSNPWAAQPEPEPQWSPENDPSQQQIWDTIVNNTPREPHAEAVLEKAAELWKKPLPLPNDRMVDGSVQHDTRIQHQPAPRQPQDPWGNTAPSETWQGNEQPHPGIPDNSGSIDTIRRPGNQREYNHSERTSNDNQDYDDEAEHPGYDDDGDDEGYDEDKSEEKSLFRRIFGGKKKKDDYDDYDEDDEDYEDEDDEDYDPDYDDEDHDEKSGSSVLKIILFVIGGLVVIALVVILVLQLLPGPTAVGDQDVPLPNTNYTDAPPDYLPVVDYPVVYEPEQPLHIEPSLFAEVPLSRISMVREGRVLFCSTQPPGVFIMNDDYSEPRALTDMLAFNGVYEPPWIYFISNTGIFRIRDDGYGEPQQIITETYHIGHRFYVFNDYLYYLRAYNENWSLNKLNLTEWYDADGEAAEERIISNVDLGFYMDSFGVYSLADQGVHAGLPSLNEELVAPTQPDLEGLNRKDVIFYSFVTDGLYRIGTLYVERFVTSRDDGVLVQTRNDGFIKEFLISWLPENSDYSHRKSFGGPHGIYELIFNQRGSHTLYRHANGTVVLIADNIEFNVFELTESAFYFLTATPTEQSITYKMMKYNLNTEDDTADVIIDFSVFDQLLVGVVDRVVRGDTSFDNFLTLPNEYGDDFEVILFAGLAISTEVPEGRLFVFDRTDGSHIELSPAV